MKHVSAVIAISLLAACGGGAGGTTQVEFSAPGEPGLDGWVRSDGDVVTLEGGPITGDFDSVNPGTGLRQFFSFDITGIPNNATIQSATVRIYQAASAGAPYATLGVVLLDHVSYGNALLAGHYDAAPLAELGTFSTNAAVGYKTKNVTEQIRADIAAARIHSQYRLRFSNSDSDDDGVNDYAAFVDTENSCCAEITPPTIEITYTTP